MAWHLDDGLAVLVQQLKDEHPGIIIGTIGDERHSSEDSDHNPDPDGSVDAIDPMYSSTYTMAMGKAEIDEIVASRDQRVKYIISDHHIISSTVDPWKWRYYDRSNVDPHTNHWHLSVNDSHHSDLSQWKIGDNMTDAQLTKLINGIVNGLVEKLPEAILNADVIPYTSAAGVDDTWRLSTAIGYMVGKERDTVTAIQALNPVDTTKK